MAANCLVVDDSTTIRKVIGRMLEKMDFQVYWGKALTKHGSVLAVDEDSLKHLKSSLRDCY